MKPTTMVVALLLMISTTALAAACGGKDKPPLTPDTDNAGLGDGGVESTPPADPASAPAAPK